MEEIDELRAKVIASMAISTSNPKKKSPKNKEEGELSSSDTEENPTSSSAPSITATPPLVESNAAIMPKSNQSSKTGNFAYANDPPSFAETQHKKSVKQNYSKPLRNSVPSKVGNRYTSSWYASSVPKNNLVISFSDDDSGSDSQEQIPEKSSGRKEIRHAAGRSSTQLDPECTPITANNQIKRMPKIASSSRTSVSSMTKIHGANSRGLGPSLVEPVPHIRNTDNACAVQEHEVSAGLNLNNRKLENLRHQIAVRENQLKLKSVQQSKSTNSGSYHDHSGINLNKSAGKKNGPASGNTTKLASNEPEKKRLRLDSYQWKLNLDGQQQTQKSATKSESRLRLPSTENIRQKNGQLVSCSPQTTLDIVAEKQPAKASKQIPVLSGDLAPRVTNGESCRPFHDPTPSKAQNFQFLNRQGDISSSCYQSGKSNRLTDLSAVSDRSSSLLQMASRENNGGAFEFNISSPKKSNMDGPKVTGTFGAVRSPALEKGSQDNVVRGSISLQDYSDHNLLGPSHVSIETLTKMEESHDKELEEAQEHRRRCELEERNALKAYREAQRALFEANAKCTHLYRKRELFSAQFRAFMMEDSSSLWSSVWHQHKKSGMDCLNDAPDADADHLHALGHKARTEFEALNNNSSIQCTNGAIDHSFCQQTMGHNLASEPCIEVDGNMLGLLHHKDNDDINGFCTPIQHTNLSADEDEVASLLDHKTTQSMVMLKDVESIEERVQDLNKNSGVSSADNPDDYALLEASLRSELFARLGTKNTSKDKNLHDWEEHVSCNGIECLDEVKSDTPFSDKQYVESKVGGSSSLAEACTSTASIFSLPFPVFKLAFSYMKVTPLIDIEKIQKKTWENCVDDTSQKEESGRAQSELVLSDLRGNMGDMGSYASDRLIDPFWPVCMFELRGKCNDEACLWQHEKDYSGRKTWQHDNPESPNYEVALSTNVENIKSAPPIYSVGLDVLKTDLHMPGLVLARSIGRCWQKGFSTFSAAPITTTQRSLFTNMPFPYSSGGRLGGQGSWSRHSLYFQSQDDVLIKQGLDDPEQFLDRALVIFDGDVNDVEGVSKARSILAQALDAYPTSLPLWIVFLSIHYRNKPTIGKDDKFSHAIHHNEGSYELWLMYVNSRVQLDDCLVAYETAIAALCRHASLPDRDTVHDSACILDFFLQSVDCLRMSGDVEKAIQRIYGLLPTPTDVASKSFISLSDILTCLTVSDKCIFWVCCVYIVIYRKLPDATVQQFGSKQELQFMVEWPSVELTTFEKHRALELMKMGVESVILNGGKYERELQFLYSSHVQCVAVLEGLSCSQNLLDKYIKVHPNCLVLVLTSARLCRIYSGDRSFERFDEAIRSWHKETPGLQCIWNQYAQCALESEGLNFAKELMVRWFESVWKVECTPSGKLDVMDDGDMYNSPESLSPNPDVCLTFSNPMDEMFGLLNLALHMWLQKDDVKARLAIDRALKVASQEDFEHCVREHAAFVLSGVLDSMEYAPSSEILRLLNIYLKDPRVLPVSEPLSRKFCRDIRKPRIRQLINNILGPIPCNFHLINSVLESWYGPSLLPENDGDLQDLVDLVETLMDLYPANYSLALAVCKLITRNFTSGIASVSVMFWARSVLVSSIYQAFPVAPEHKWLEAADILSNLVDAQDIIESFHLRALSIYPFSIKVWMSYYNFSKKTGNGSLVIQRAREKGVKLE
ncbi:zinc finger C3H1 domain protein [Thalictrum thalictroides]|uniref:Zinc finger C3H1 domain protein n=1 Tax=Thalictrum thalictroides TaxID=46969 RepID=A0A7J6WUJ5_THATH|nr:zinc finger C3H1 domain protein [Thalictrum thalictroides]